MMEGCSYVNPATGEKCDNIAHMAHHCMKHCRIDILVPWFEEQERKLEKHNDKLMSHNMALREKIGELQVNQKRARIQW